MTTYKIENGKIKREIEISNSDILQEYSHLNERKIRLQQEITNNQNEISSIEVQLTDLSDIIKELELEVNQ